MYIEKFLEDTDLINDISSDIDEISTDEPIKDINFDEAFYDLMYESDYNMDIIYKQIGLPRFAENTSNNVVFIEDTIIDVNDFTDKSDEKDDKKTTDNNEEKQVKSFSEKIKALIEGFKKFFANIYRKLQELYFNFIANIKKIDYDLKRKFIDNKDVITNDNIKKACDYVFTDKDNVIVNKRIIDDKKFSYNDYMKMNNIRDKDDVHAFIAEKFHDLDDLKALDKDYNENDMNAVQKMVDNFNKKDYYESITKEVDSVDFNELVFIINKLNMQDLSKGFMMLNTAQKSLKYLGAADKIITDIKRRKERMVDKTPLNKKLSKIFSNYAFIIKQCNAVIRLASLKYVTTMQAVKDSKDIAFKIIKACSKKEKDVDNSNDISYKNYSYEPKYAALGVGGNN